jgi:hypothetical protein
MIPTSGTSQNWGKKKKNKENRCYLVSLLAMRYIKSEYVHVS